MSKIKPVICFFVYHSDPL